MRLDSYVRNNLESYFPFIVKDAIEIIQVSFNELLIKLNDGTSVLYDDRDNSIRMLPIDSHNMTEDETRHEFGIRLTKMMQLKGVTQNELSKLTGIPQSMISSYVNGRYTPSFYAVDKIAKALDCSTDDFRYFLNC